VHLKSLTLKGFKSFASATTLEFEPGITCVVGPNGSGKSNVVDAIAWVMGEQGAKSLRGGKMEDVIFAGTSGRAPLGRAEVTLTIDNSDNRLPIDYAEVSITRTLFRSGGSEYAINGSACRLLDVQELLSDSGIGREMHVIVGQGRLDAILRATPEDRRGFIEEAAGVLKHRKRKEKALRKLDAMSANLTRLQDLTGELKRQLKPLGRQAEVARRAQVIQSDVRDARLRLLADDLVNFKGTLVKEEADEAVLRERRSGLEAQLSTAQIREAEVDSLLAADAPRSDHVNEVHLRLTALRERFAGLIGLASERARHLDEPEQLQFGPDPDQLDYQAKEAELAFEAISAEVGALAVTLSEREAQVKHADHTLAQALAAEQERNANNARRREALARLAGEHKSATTRLEARDAEIERLTVREREAAARLEQREVELDATTDNQPAQDIDVDVLAGQRDAAIAARDSLATALSEATKASQAAARDCAGLEARIEALRLSVASESDKGGIADFAAVLGPVTDCLRVSSGWESAIDAALSVAAHVDALAVADLAAATQALDFIRESGAGRTTLVLAGPQGGALQKAPAPSPGIWAADLISPSAVHNDPVQVAITEAAQQLLADFVVVEDLATAAGLVASHPTLRVVTRAGELLSAAVAVGGSGYSSKLHIAAALEETQLRHEQALLTAEELEQKVQSLTQQHADAARTAKAARELHSEQQSLHSARQSALALGASQRASAQAELDRLSDALDQAKDQRENAVKALEVAAVHFEEAQAAADADQSEPEDTEVNVEELRAGLINTRREEVDARLAVRTAEERMNASRDRSVELRAAAARERQDREQARAARARAIAQAQVAATVLRVAHQAAAKLEGALLDSQKQRTEVEESRRARQDEVASLRTTTREIAEQIDKLTSDVHRDEVARAEQRLRVEQLETRAMEEFGIEAQELMTEYGPAVMVPPSAVAIGDEIDESAPAAQPYPFVRAEQEKRLKTAEKSMALLGRVNPLALEEFTAMEERHTFLTTQLDDLKRSRQDLLGIVDEVDERVQQVFAEAFADVQREFEGVFGRLFPGGEGRLVLTDPNDLLTTGIEVEARPAGKRVKRLSLLSGGERSLTAVAFLVALFKARPSPFYLLDEVEAALDDVNLGRLLSCLEELRASSQLLVITHQKRTMEIADALYGVTMREGVTQVISQRMRELVPV